MMLLMTVFVFQIFGGPRAEHANHRRSMVEPINMEIPMDYEDAPDEFFFVHINYTPTAKPQGLKNKFRRLFRF